MAHRILAKRPGGPEVLEYESYEPAAPGPGEALVRQAAIGLNFIDVYHRTGLYKVPLPSGIGKEGAGIVESVGEGVTVVAPGDRVTEGVTVHDFLNLCAGIPPYDFNPPPYPGV